MLRQRFTELDLSDLTILLYIPTALSVWAAISFMQYLSEWCSWARADAAVAAAVVPALVAMSLSLTVGHVRARMSPPVEPGAAIPTLAIQCTLLSLMLVLLLDIALFADFVTGAWLLVEFLVVWMGAIWSFLAWKLGIRQSGLVLSINLLAPLLVTGSIYVRLQR